MPPGGGVDRHGGVRRKAANVKLHRECPCSCVTRWRSSGRNRHAAIGVAVTVTVATSAAMSAAMSAIARRSAQDVKRKAYQAAARCVASTAFRCFRRLRWLRRVVLDIAEALVVGGRAFQWTALGGRLPLDERLDLAGEREVLVGDALRRMRLELYDHECIGDRQIRVMP